VQGLRYPLYASHDHSQVLSLGNGHLLWDVIWHSFSQQLEQGNQWCGESLGVQQFWYQLLSLDSHLILVARPSDALSVMSTCTQTLILKYFLLTSKCPQEEVEEGLVHISTQCYQYILICIKGLAKSLNHLDAVIKCLQLAVVNE
jgi:hypothetical protein